MRVFLPFSFALVLAGCAAVQSNSQPWPAAEKQALLAECRAHIWQRAENDYRKEHNESQLPPDFRQIMSAESHELQPSLARCACFIDQLENAWSYEELVMRSSQVSEKVRQIRESGACARPVTR